jgi:DNA repair exonuclease SbcCD ATPase subunit
VVGNRTYESAATSLIGSIRRAAQEGKSMEDIKAQLEGLKQRLDKLESDRAATKADVADASRALEGQQLKLHSLSAAHQAVVADLEATVKLGSELDAVTHALDSVRERGNDELSKGRDELAALKSRVEQELSDARRTALLHDVKAIDDAIDDAKSKAQQAADALTVAETAQEKARDEAAAAAQKHDDTLQRLQAAPGTIEAARARMVALRDATTNAVDAGRMAEGFVRSHDLELALATLEAALKPDATDPLFGELPNLWQDKLAKADALAGATKEVGPRQAEAASARQLRDTLIAGRDQHITSVLNEPPQKPGEHESSGGDEHPGADTAEAPSDRYGDTAADPGPPR